MILKAMIRNHLRNITDQASMDVVLAEIAEGLEVPDRKGYLGSHGERAELYFVSAGAPAEPNPFLPNPSGAAEPDHCLYVSVNHVTGYGGLIWFSMDDRPETPSSPHGIWVSDNPVPPESDQDVPADPYHGLYHATASTLPVATVIAAVNEFFRAGTGDRPGSISWVAGNMQGARLPTSAGGVL